MMADVTQNTNGADGAVSPGALTRVVDGALTKQNAAVDAYVRKLRGWSQGANGGKRDGSPAAALRAAEKQYLAAVTGMGAGVGAAAAAPGVGTALSLAVSTAEMGANLEATALLVLTYAAIHDLDVDDLERRRALFYGVALGNAGSVAVEKIAGRTGPHWAKSAVNAVSKDTLAKINGVLGPHFVTKYGTRRGVLVLGRVAPFGVGPPLVREETRRSASSRSARLVVHSGRLRRSGQRVSHGIPAGWTPRVHKTTTQRRHASGKQAGTLNCGTPSQGMGSTPKAAGPAEWLGCRRPARRSDPGRPHGGRTPPCGFTGTWRSCAHVDARSRWAC